MRILEKKNPDFPFFLFSNFLFQKMFLSKCLCYIGGGSLCCFLGMGGSTFQTLGFSSSQIKNKSELSSQGKKKRKKKQLNIRTLEREREKKRLWSITLQLVGPLCTGAGDGTYMYRGSIDFFLFLSRLRPASSFFFLLIFLQTLFQQQQL